MKSYDIAKHGYIVNEQALTELARAYAEGVDTTTAVRASYLQILVAHSKQELGTKRATPKQQIDALETAHASLYAIILEAITTPQLEPSDELPAEESRRRSRERNRRTTFARTSKSTLLHWLRSGGKLGSLDPAKVTKEALRVQSTPTAKLDVVVERAESALERALRVMVVQDPEGAQDLVNEIQGRLQAIVTPPKPLVKSRTKVGSLTLTPH